VALYTLESVFQILFLTLGVTLAIGIAGAVYPKSVEHWGGFLLTGLFVIIFGDIARIFMSAYGFEPVTLGIWDWIAALVFCGLIFYDMNRAVRLDRTLDNAVDMAIALYLDIINLFIRLLAIAGNKRD
jgi:FtsH-binding integral membrane protein